ncbi:MAG TPA: hypothetical protein DCQ83_02305 [Fibrobacteres bacterium]|jgi:hypothetical protein|nr:hypothetical protein [Fibrobacterota bacterium]
MRNILPKSLLLLGFPVALSLGTTNWKPLFNGTTFAGWHFAGDQTYWTIDAADSAIVGYSATVATPYTMVFSDSATWDQFTVKYSYRLKAGCSGFFFRAVENNTAERVAGVQVEAKFASGKQSEVGSLYDHPSPGWVVQHSQTYSDRIARTPSTVYQDVILTVKRPYVYVNVNGYQAVGETDLTELNLGGKAAWNYTSSPIIVNPGKFGLQIHAGQLPMDVRFKNIALLEGCGDSTSARYDGKFVPGLTKQPAVYKDNGTCAGGSPISSSESNHDASRYIGAATRSGNELVLPVLQAGARQLEVSSLRGQVLFSVLNPVAKEYRIPVSAAPAVYVARLQTGSASVVRKIAVP